MDNILELQWLPMPQWKAFLLLVIRPVESFVVTKSWWLILLSKIWLFLNSVTRLGEILLFGYFLFDLFIHFLLKSRFKTWFVVPVFNVQRELDADVLDFQFEVWYFGYSFGHISKYWANFKSIFWSLCFLIKSNTHQNFSISLV